MKPEVKEKIEQLRRERWIEAVFHIEAIGANKEVVEKSLRAHVEKLTKVKDVYVYEKNFHEIIEVGRVKNVEHAYSQYVEVKLFVKNLLALLSVIVLYAPSSVEILSPEKIETDISELQNICNALASLIHRFAEAGVGGVVITPR